MTTAAKITYLTALLCGLFLGALFGFRRTSDTLHLFAESNTYVEGPGLSEYSYLQYKHAYVENAKNALLLETSFRRRFLRVHPESHASAPLWLPFTRLAILEEHEGNLPQSRLYFDQARSVLGKRDSYVSDDVLRSSSIMWDNRFHM